MFCRSLLKSYKGLIKVSHMLVCLCYLIFKSSSTSLHICLPSRNLWITASYPAWQVKSGPCVITKSTIIATQPYVNPEYSTIKCRSRKKIVVNVLHGSKSSMQYNTNSLLCHNKYLYFKLSLKVENNSPSDPGLMLSLSSESLRSKVPD